MLDVSEIQTIDHDVMAAPRSPMPAIHQMCQIREKPVMTAKNAVTNPAGLFFGISIG